MNKGFSVAAGEVTAAPMEDMLRLSLNASGLFAAGGGEAGDSFGLALLPVPTPCCCCGGLVCMVAAVCANFAAIILSNSSVD